MCSDGYEDCNKDMIDGCEIDLSSDVEHCGACNGVNLNGENSNCKESVVNAYGIECLSGVCSYYGGCLSIEDDAFFLLVFGATKKAYFLFRRRSN